MTDFSAAYPQLYHVTDRSAVAAIASLGLRSARSLYELHNIAQERQRIDLRQNRKYYTTGPVVLRRQGMSDRALMPRLDPTIRVEEWRWFINGLIFFFPTLTAARALRLAEPTRDQVVLAFPTRALLDAAVPIATCAFNNGYIDRAPVSTARKRRFDDYRPLEEWSGGRPAEVVATMDVPSSVEFAVLTPP